MKSPVTIGDLRHRVVIETETRVSDGAGGFTSSWAPVVTLWAAIWPRSANEVFAHDRVAGQATHDIWIRHRPGIRPLMRVRWDTRVFDIKGVIDVEDRGRWLRCPAEEIDL